MHEAVETAGLGHDILAGLQMEMVGVGQDHLGPRVLELSGGEGLDVGEGADGHESRRLDGAVVRNEDTRAGVGVAALGLALVGKSGLAQGGS